MAGFRSIVLFAGALMALTAGLPATAQTIAKPNAAAKPADSKAADAAKAFAAGTGAFESGKINDAVAALSSAIATGALKNPELAKALFYRGVAQRQQKKPGAALSDLNAAVWLRDGLSATDKSVAEDHRQALLREVAGVNAAAPVQSAVAAPEAAAVASPEVPEAAASPPAGAVADAAPPTGTEPPKAEAPLPWATAAAAADPVTVAAPESPSEVSAPAPVAAEAAPVADAPPVASTVSEEPMPWAAAAPAEPSPEPSAALVAPSQSVTEDSDTVAGPVAVPAVVERAAISSVDGEPAPPEKPLPWQTAAAAPPASEAPLPWGEARPVPPAVAEAAPVPATTAAPPAEPVAAFASTEDTGGVALPGAPNVIAAAPAALADAGKAAGAFIGTLFAGGQTTPAAAEAEPAAVEVAAVAPVATPEPVEPAPIETRSIETASIRTSDASPPVEVQAVPPPLPTLPGPYRLQIGAENTRAGAETTLSRLIAGHGRSLQGREPVIEEPATGNVLFGSMAAAYRVSIGPYTHAAEASRLCNILQPHGFECRVVGVTP